MLELRSKTEVFAARGNRTLPLYCQRAGVKQGYPASGGFFDIGLGPFLRSLLEDVGEDGMMRALADDIAIPLISISMIGPICIKHSVLHRISSLAIKIKKCRVILLSRVFIASTCDAICDILKRIAPTWCCMNI